MCTITLHRCESKGERGSVVCAFAKSAEPGQEPYPSALFLHLSGGSTAALVDQRPHQKMPASCLWTGRTSRTQHPCVLSEWSFKASFPPEVECGISSITLRMNNTITREKILLGGVQGALCKMESNVFSLCFLPCDACSGLT